MTPPRPIPQNSLTAVAWSAATLFLAMLALFLPACGNYFAPNINLTRTAADSEIVGTWQLTPDSLTLLQRDGYKPTPGEAYTITFHPSGQLDFDSVDSWDLKHRTGKGTWKLVHQNAMYAGHRVTNELKVNDGVKMMSFGLTETNGQLTLYDFHGDPDSWEFIEYKRVP